MLPREDTRFYFHKLVLGRWPPVRPDQRPHPLRYSSGAVPCRARNYQLVKEVALSGEAGERWVRTGAHQRGLELAARAWQPSGLSTCLLCQPHSAKPCSQKPHQLAPCLVLQADADDLDRAFDMVSRKDLKERRRALDNFCVSSGQGAPASRRVSGRLGGSCVSSSEGHVAWLAAGRPAWAPSGLPPTRSPGSLCVYN